MAHLTIVLLLQLAPVGLLAAQTIRSAGQPVRVAPGLEQYPLIEPHLVADPRNPNHLLAAAMVSTTATEFEQVESKMRCASFLSLDGGATWARHEFPLAECFDPWVVITRDGHAVFSALARHPTLSGEQFVVFRSPDGGRTWSDTPVALGAGHDHPTMVADLSAPERAGWIYALSSQNVPSEDGTVRRQVFVARSRDAGKTFDAPTRLLPSNLFVSAEVPVVLSDGTLVVSFVDVTPDEGRPRRAWVVRSSDGGETYSLPTYVTDACGPPRFPHSRPTSLAGPIEIDSTSPATSSVVVLLWSPPRKIA